MIDKSIKDFAPIIRAPSPLSLIVSIAIIGSIKKPNTFHVTAFKKLLFLLSKLSSYV